MSAYRVRRIHFEKAQYETSDGGSGGGSLALLAAFPAWAASSTKKITSITLEIEADIEPGTDFGEESIEFDASGDKFYVGDYEVKNDGQAWEEDTVPKLEVTLEANDDYRFSTSIRKDKIRLKGVGAVCKGRCPQGGGTAAGADHRAGLPDKVLKSPSKMCA